MQALHPAKALLLSLLIVAAALCQTQAQLVVRTAGSVQKGADTQVTIQFSAPVEDASSKDPANYSIAGVTVRGVELLSDLPDPEAIGTKDNNPASFRSGPNQVAILTVSPLTPGNPYRLTVRNVASRADANDAITVQTVSFVASAYRWAETGTPALKGHVVAISDEGFDIYSGGATQWANYDEVTIVYRELTGNFDVKTRMEFVDSSSQWARAGTMARVSLNENEGRPLQQGNPETGTEGTASPYIDVHTNPARSFNSAAGGSMMINANNQWESHYRPAPGAQTASVGGGTPDYPNAWVRIARDANTITTYRSNDGDTWETIAERDISDWNASKLFVGPAFSPEIGNIAVPEGQGRLFLAQYRFKALASAFVKTFEGSPAGVVIRVQDTATSKLVPNSVKLSFNGTTVTPTVTPGENGLSAISYNTPSLLDPNSSHTVLLEYADNSGKSTRTERSFVVPSYLTLPPAFASRTVNTSAPGFRARVHQVGSVPATSNDRAERQLGGLLGDNIGIPGPNTDGSYNLDAYVNWNQDAPAAIGNFTADNGREDEPIPGLGDGTDNIAAEITAYLDLKRGFHRLGVNSDEGFFVTAGPDARDALGILLGSFDGTRTSADTTFGFAVSQDGIYPIRLVWYEGANAANLEFFSVDPISGNKILINDRATPGHIKAYREAGTSSLHVRSVVPGRGATRVDLDANLIIQFQEGSTTLNQASFKVKLNGTDAPATLSKNGNVVTATVNPAANFEFSQLINVELTYADNTGASRTERYAFTSRGPAPTDLPAGSFWIEAEDFDFDGGRTQPTASTMPYAGGAYDGLGGTEGIDFNNDDANDSDLYRTETNANGEHEVNLNDNLAGRYGRERARGAEVTVNYKIGWVADGDWANYTRAIPQGSYKVFAALSYDGTSPGQLRGSLQRVTAGAGSRNQTLQNLGDFNAPGSGGWGPNDLVVMKDASGKEAVIQLGGPTTLRFSMSSGDFDWFVLAPASSTNNTPAAFTKASLQGANLVIEWTGTAILQSADNITGPWNDVAAATSPATISPAGARRFYRLKQ